MELLVVMAILALQGLFIGAFARLALPGPDPLTLWQTMGVGLAGSFLAGLLFYFLAGTGPSFLAALVFSVGIVYLIRRRRGGGVLSADADAAERRRRRGY